VRYLLKTFWSALGSRFLPPLVLGFFFLAYVGIAFFTDETLIALMGITRSNIFLAALLALIPLNALVRLARETVRQLRRRQALNGAPVRALPELFDESVELRGAEIPVELEGRLHAAGYRTRRVRGSLAAWRGFGLFPARLLFLAATCFLFSGILASTTVKAVARGMVIEGGPFPCPSGPPARVERITLSPSTGSILARRLTIEVAPEEPGGRRRSFQLYPPSQYGGAFVYPRYLGIGLLVRFAAPDLPQGFEDQAALNLYPPGKEGSVAVPGSPYRLDFSVAVPPEGEDRYGSYVSEHKTLQVKLLKGKDLLFSGALPEGGALVRDGYRIELPEVKRLVVTDFVRDYGVYCVWAALALYLAAALLYLPLRICWPRREMLFRAGPDSPAAYSRAEGRSAGHAGVFHDALDLLETRATEPAGQVQQ